MTRKPILILLAVAVAGVGGYALAGFQGVPRLVRGQVTELFARDYGRDVSLGDLRFNPFTFEFEALDFSVPDADGTRMLGFDRLYVNFELSSLWRRAWTFAEIDLDGPYVRVVQRPDGAINLLDLAPPAEEPPPSSQDEAALPSLWIEDLQVNAGRVDVQDDARAEPFATTLAPVTFELTDFRTVGSGNSFSFTAGSDLAGRLSVDGTFGVDPLRSHGSLKLTELQATAVSTYLGELLPVTLQGGVVDLGFDYDFELAGDPFTFVLQMPELTVRELVTVARGHEVPWQIPAVEVRDTRLDLAAQSLTVGSIEVRDVSAPVWLDATGFNAPGVLPRAEAGSAPVASSAAAEDGGAAWTVSIPSIRILNTRVPFEDRTLATPQALELTASALQLEGFALPAAGPLRIGADVASGAGGQVSARGTLQLEPLAADLEVTTRALNLTPVQAYLRESTDLLFDSGTLSSEGRLKLAALEPLDLGYEGRLSVEDLGTRDRPLQQDFVKWQSLEVEGIRYSSRPSRLAIQEIIAHQPYLRLVLAENGTTNIEAVLDPKGTAAKAAAIAAGRADAGSEDASRGRQEAPPSPQPAPGIAITVGRTRIVDGNANFADFTVRPNFRIAMENLNGSIKGSSSDPSARSELELAGQVDRYAPVHIAGRLNLLAPDTFIDIEGEFSNIDLASFNPYSTKFIGYQIAKGKLSIDTSYKVEDNRLAAVHGIRIDQLEFGEKIDSPDAIGLPVKLAVALLKDSKGVIQLDLPVEGTLDDPQFKLGPVIWKVFVGLLTKIVTAPFAALGSLFGDGPDLSYIDFAAGSTELSAMAQEKVATLRQGLAERPALKLEIPWTVVPSLDRPPLEEAAWAAALQEAAGSPSDPAAAWKTDRAAYLRRLEQLFLQRNGVKPELAKPPRPAEGEPKPDPVEFAIAQLEPGLRAGVSVGDEVLEQLAQARALAVRDALLGEAGLDAERVFITRQGESQDEGGAVRMTLSLE